MQPKNPWQSWVLFHHKIEHKETWHYPYGTSPSQIDHMLVSTRNVEPIEEEADRRGCWGIDSSTSVRHSNSPKIQWSEILLSYYSSPHQSLKWYKKLTFHIFEMMMLNSYFCTYKLTQRCKYKWYKKCDTSYDIPPTTTKSPK